MKRHHRHTALAALFLAQVFASSAFGENGEESENGEDVANGANEVIVVQGRETTAVETRAARALGEAELVTRIEVGEQTPESATLADVLSNSVGAEIRSVGGLGGFASVSVRGLGAGHTPVFVDGVPLSRIATIGADLSRFDLHGFSALELYRGAVPASLGDGGIGGALNLVSAVGSSESSGEGAISAGLGSFGARHLRGRYLGGVGAMGYQLGIGYAGADGDYPFFNDNGTNLNTSDDTRERRTNNGFDRIDAVLRARERSGTRLVLGGARVFAKRQGLPGIGSRQTNRSALEGATGILDTTLIDRVGSLALRSHGYGMIDKQRVIDDDSEVGLGSGESVSTTASAGLSGSVGTRVSSLLERATLSLEGRGDWFDQRGNSSQEGSRLTVAVAADGHVSLGERISVVPQLRALVSRTAASASDGSEPMRTDVDPSARLAAIVRLPAIVTLKASAGYAVRQPTIVEMFGDRGFLAGNPTIRAERGLSADIGLVVAPLPSGAIEDALFEAAAFASRPTDAIVYAPAAGGVAKPFNLDGARMLGAELSATLRLVGHFRLSANYTFLSAVARSESELLNGNALPHRSQHQAYGRIAFEHDRFSTWTDVNASSGNYIDQANILEVPRRLFVGAGITININDSLSLTGEGKNLADNTVENIALDPAPRPDLAQIPRPVSDFFGYPLPGRAFYVSLAAKL